MALRNILAISYIVTVCFVPAWQTTMFMLLPVWPSLLFTNVFLQYFTVLTSSPLVGIATNTLSYQNSWGNQSDSKTQCSPFLQRNRKVGERKILSHMFAHNLWLGHPLSHLLRSKYEELQNPFINNSKIWIQVCLDFKCTVDPFSSVSRYGEEGEINTADFFYFFQ